MSPKQPSLTLIPAMLLLLVLPAWFGSSARGAARPPVPNDKDKDVPTSLLRIEVVAGNDSHPVAEASVYVKFNPDPPSRKSKQVELNLKTSQEGIAQSPAVPRGKVLIQIIAPGWKTYGEWFDIDRPEQTIRIHLMPNGTRWY